MLIDLEEAENECRHAIVAECWQDVQATLRQRTDLTTTMTMIWRQWRRNWIRKTKNIPWNAGIYRITEILWITASWCKISLKLGNMLLSYGQKTIFIWRPCAIFIFKMSHLVTCLLSSSKGAVVYQVSTKLQDFLLRYGDLMTCNMAAVCHVESAQFSVFLMWPILPSYSVSLYKIFLKSENRLLSYSQKTIFKMALVCHLEFKKCSYLITRLSLSTKCAAVYQISSRLDDFFMEKSRLFFEKMI